MILIEHSEIDRFQQRQLREHSPKFQAMVPLLNNILGHNGAQEAFRKEAAELDFRFADPIQ